MIVIHRARSTSWKSSLEMHSTEAFDWSQVVGSPEDIKKASSNEENGKVGAIEGDEMKLDGTDVKNEMTFPKKGEKSFCSSSVGVAVDGTDGEVIDQDGDALTYMDIVERSSCQMQVPTLGILDGVCSRLFQ